MSFSRIFQKLNVKKIVSLPRCFYSAQSLTRFEVKSVPAILCTNLVENAWVWKQGSRIEAPLGRRVPFEAPKIVNWVPAKSDPRAERKIEEPQLETNKYEKKAVKLIVIRRHKMRKHKLKKLRKRMKFEWAKKRQRREMKKEKEFQAGLLAQIKDAEAFSAQHYVADKLREATEEKVPRFWKGKRLPEFIIREKLGLPPK